MVKMLVLSNSVSFGLEAELQSMLLCTGIIVGVQYFLSPCLTQSQVSANHRSSSHHTLWAGATLWNAAEGGRTFSNIALATTGCMQWWPAGMVRKQLCSGCSARWVPAGAVQGLSPSSPRSRPGVAAVACPLVLWSQLLALPLNCSSQCTVRKSVGKSLLKFAHLWGDWLADP